MKEVLQKLFSRSGPAPSTSARDQSRPGKDMPVERALLRLFNAVRLEDAPGSKHERAVLERGVRNGYVLDPRIKPTPDLLDVIEDVIGLTGEKANAAFHKSWTIVREASREDLVMQQIVHYLTTYGFEDMGIYRESSVYIPNEVLQLPEITDDMPLTVVRALDRDEVLERIIKLGSGIALADRTLADIMTLVEDAEYESGFVAEIKNRELKGRLSDFYDLVPDEPVEYLRYLVSKLTDESLLIKNAALIEKLENANGKFLDVLLKDAPADLGSIFLRYKPLFLAMKKISKNKTFFNRLRKQAVRLHKPLPEDYLNSVTTQIKRGTLDLGELDRRLDGASLFRKIRLAYALNFRLHHTGSIVYKIRNGRGWATDFDWWDVDHGQVERALSRTVEAITKEMRPAVEGKAIYIPETVHYALPASEKQFTGHIPTGSYVSVPQDMIVGIHWFNTKRRIDLDLSAVGSSGKIGWDAAYRTGEGDVLFSGDVTTAPRPNGASELFYLRAGTPEPRILNVNYFNFDRTDPVECRLLVAQDSPRDRFGKDYLVDVSKIVAQANLNITQKQSLMGLITSADDENRFYFANVSIGTSITARADRGGLDARDYLIASTTNTLDLATLLEAAGAILVASLTDTQNVIDLSPSALDKSTIIDLLRPSA